MVLEIQAIAFFSVSRRALPEKKYNQNFFENFKHFENFLIQEVIEFFKYSKFSKKFRLYFFRVDLKEKH